MQSGRPEYGVIDAGLSLIAVVIAFTCWPQQVKTKTLKINNRGVRLYLQLIYYYYREHIEMTVQRKYSLIKICYTANLNDFYSNLMPLLRIGVTSKHCIQVVTM